MEYGIIGENLSHSLSELIHSKILGYDYKKIELSQKDLNSFIKRKEFKGINVTIPFKEKIIEYLDVISENAKRIGAVNTIVNKDGILYGFNTDYLGLNDSLKNSCINLNNKNVLILGTGGTAKTASFVCKNNNAKSIKYVSRSKIADDIISYENLYKYKKFFDVIINTTPVGMYPNVKNCILNLNDFENIEAVFDVIYNPLRSSLIQDFENKCNTSSGLYMLISQALHSYQLFNLGTYSKDLVNSIYKKVLSTFQNIVLVGPPYSGKTSIGYKLSKKLKMNFIDTDEEIEKETHQTIKEIFKNRGETHFREIEKQVIKKVSFLHNTVISTGGGALLDKENIFYLKLYGKVIFINRDINDIIIDEKRPIIDSFDKLKKIYNERFFTYKENSDNIIYNKEIDYAVGRIENYYENLCN